MNGLVEWRECSTTLLQSRRRRTAQAARLFPMMDAACKDSGFPGRYFDKNGIMEFFVAEEGLPPRNS